jgi:hypothetical protein
VKSVPITTNVANSNPGHGDTGETTQWPNEKGQKFHFVLRSIAAYDVVDILYLYVLQMFSSIITVSSS